MAKNQWTIKPESAGQRLDVFLADKMPDTTRSAISKKLKAGAGSIDGKKAAVHTFLKVGQKVRFEQIVATTVRHEKQIRVAQPVTIKLKDIVIKETPDWIVVNKPAGLLVHPDSQHEDGTLIDVLIAHFPPLAKVGEDPSRPGVVHRLDKEVSGLMVVAKTQDAYDNFKQQFSHHQTKKVYLALVQGAPPKEDGDIRFRIARSGTHARMSARPENDPRGKVAWSHYRVLKRIKNYTLLEVEILSGRTHQIRAHLFALRCPVVGDQLYKTSNLQERVDARHPARLMLQSVELTFDDPQTGERLTFSIPPDPSFEEFMKN
jgi:23S rRNA pseudouridine1911/1915/1917 synthase